ncbi:MAG: phosphoribosylformylglycinamidine synthase I [Ilumatobacteraceae bacterium]
MSAVPALVIAGPGTNRDRDLELAFELAGANVAVALVDELAERPELLREARIVGIAGGFSYGDALGAGRMMALDLMAGIGEEMTEFVATGRPVIGICNGFQVLTRSKLLPGALGHNVHGRFECRWVVLEPQPRSRCLWTRGLDQPIHCPIAHGEGRYVHPDPGTLAEAGQVALRYRSTNPNGSVADIAGVCNAAGNVLGLMPHPENFVVGRQHPHHLRGAGLEHLGLSLFRNGVAAAGEM